MPLLPSTVTQVTGVDISQEMVDFASKNFQHNLLNFHKLDIERIIQPRMVFPDGFTKVIILYLLNCNERYISRISMAVDENCLR